MKGSLDMDLVPKGLGSERIPIFFRASKGFKIYHLGVILRVIYTETT
jgi:hypothetical protein